MKEMFENERSSTHSLLRIEKHLEEGVKTTKELVNGLVLISDTLKESVKH